MSRRKLATFASLLAMASTLAQDPTVSPRTWTDATGQFSIQASLVDWTDQEVRLRCPDGKRLAIDVEKLCAADRRYLVAAAPTPVDIEPLQLPNAIVIVPDGSPLETVSAMSDRITWSQPKSLAADPAPEIVSIPECVVSIASLDGWAHCSRPLLTTPDETPKIAISITRGLMLTAGGSQNQILLIDPASSQLETLWEGSTRITLLDHHLPSGLTLVLNGHNGVGEGGQIELTKLTGERLEGSADRPSNGLRSFARHELPANDQLRTQATLRWARLVDDEHALAVIDDSLGCWNLLSAACLYRVNKIDSRTEPVLSPGRRYMALPRRGELVLYSTADGKQLGRLELDRNLTPNVAFSPAGDQLAIISGKRLRIWDLSRATMTDEIENRRTLGSSEPVWLNRDLVMSSNGIVMSRSRQSSVWQYDVIGDTIASLGDRVMLLRKYRSAELAVMSLPHPAAASYIASLATDVVDETTPTKSKWRDGAWSE